MTIHLYKAHKEHHFAHPAPTGISVAHSITSGIIATIAGGWSLAVHDLNEISGKGSVSILYDVCMPLENVYMVENARLSLIRLYIIQCSQHFKT